MPGRAHTHTRTHTHTHTHTHTQFQDIATQHIIDPYTVTVQPAHYCTGFFPSHYSTPVVIRLTLSH